RGAGRHATGAHFLETTRVDPGRARNATCGALPGIFDQLVPVAVDRGIYRAPAGINDLHTGVDSRLARHTEHQFLNASAINGLKRSPRHCALTGRGALKKECFFLSFFLEVFPAPPADWGVNGESCLPPPLSPAVEDGDVVDEVIEGWTGYVCNLAVA